MRDEELRRRVREDVDAATEAEPFLPIVKRLSQWQSPAPSAQDTARLVESLVPELPSRATLSSFRILHSALLLRSQLRVIRGEIWPASALVMALGALVTLAGIGPGASVESLPFVFVAPIVVAIGVTFLYGPANDPSLEVELATPVTPRMILLARLALLFGLNLGLGLSISAVLAAWIPGVSLWPLVMAWLAPMAFLSALTFLLSIVFVDSPVSILAGLLLWIMQGIKQVASAQGLFVLTYWPNWLSGEARPLLWIAAAILVGLALWVGGRQERWVA